MRARFRGRRADAIRNKKAPANAGAFFTLARASVATADTFHHDRVASPFADRHGAAAAAIGFTANTFTNAEANAVIMAAMLPVATAVPIAAAFADPHVDLCHR